MEFPAGPTEPRLAELPSGSQVTVVFELLVYNPGSHVCRSALHNQIFLTDCCLAKGYTYHTVLLGKIGFHNEKVWVLQQSSTFAFQRPQMDMQGLFHVVEACSGISALSQGYRSCGAEVVCHVDPNPVFIQWLRAKSKVPSILGNISQPSTVAAVASVVQQAHVLSAGISCQPFSGLGDQKQQNDSRSESCPAAIQMGYLLGSVMTILECTKQAFSSHWVQTMLHEFSMETKFQIVQAILPLHPIWPAKRDRWWCIIAHPALNLRALPQMPAHRFEPGLVHLVNTMLHLEGDPLSQLLLDPYELEQFAAVRGGLSSHFVDVCKACPTATHSWGSQLRACQCGCRSSGFHPDRLADRGLYGQLIPLPTETTIRGQRVQEARHLHPAEVAIFNGMSPDILFADPVMPLRLDLAGVGQLGSPIQSAWVLGNVLYQVSRQGLLQWEGHPREVMYHLCQDLFRSRDQHFPIGTASKYMDLFAREIHSLAHPCTFPPVATEDAPENTADLEQFDVPSPEPPTENLTQAIADALNQESNASDILEAQSLPLTTQEPFAIVPASIPSETPFSSTESFQIGVVPGFAAQHNDMHSTAGNTRSDAKIPDADDCSRPTCSRARSRSRSRFADRLTAKMSQPMISDAAACSKVVSLQCKSPEPSEIAATLPDCPSVDEPDHVQDVEPVATNDRECIFYAIYPQGAALNVQFTPGQTLKDLYRAEQSLHFNVRYANITSFLGTQVDDHLQLVDGQAFCLDRRITPPVGSVPPPILTNATRAELLWRQQGWVAEDEMDFYLQLVEASHPSTVLGAFCIPDSPDTMAMVAHRVLQTVQVTSQDLNGSEKALVLKYKDHWFPIFVRVAQPDVEIWTTSAELSFLQQALATTLAEHGFQLHGLPMPHAFPADCGFQTVGWLLSMLLEEDINVPWSMHQAFEWRALFHQHLQDNGLDEAYVARPLCLGGAKSLADQLGDLVVQHGVNPARGPECADQLIKALGPAAIQQVLSSPKPWADLKAKASLKQLRVVLASELQDLIAQRAKDPRPLGKKQNKVKQTSQPKKGIQLKADQLAVPPAVFRQADGQELSQLPMSQVCQGCRGILVANIDESLPYFSLQAPLSQGGVGLLILDFQDSRLPASHQVIKVPAVCTVTNEPVIVTAALVQLGAMAVERNTPEQCPAIQEVPNSVLRVLVFRDQYPTKWADFCQGPAKHVLERPPFDQIASSEVLDVWDRQYLSLRMRREKPEHAELFSCNVRLADQVCQQVLQQSGVDGTYFEPRTQDGRSPHPGFQVVWLPRKTFGEAKVAQTSTAQGTMLVRNGDRYGLRVKPDEAEKVHQLHRPELQFLQGSDLKKYKMGPLPYGSTKQSIMTLCKRWGWQARPIGPQGQTADRCGTMWALQAAQNPPSWVYQLAHGDVLISPEDVTVQQQARPIPVLASQKTLQSLTQPAAAVSQDDPWLHYDPWKGTGKTKELSVGQVTSIEANVEKRVMAKIQSEDATMTAVDSRVNALEQQLEQLSSSVTAFQQGQTQQNQQVQQQLQSLDAKIDHQSKTFGSVLDSKLDDQMKRIESLLLKRRNGE